MKLNISGIDLSIVVVYLIGIISVGVWAGFRQRRAAAGDSSYFLAGRSLRWPIIGLAMFATNISTIHLVSLAQEGYVNGLAYGNFEWMAIFSLIALALFFAPFYIRAKVSTLPDFLEQRYSRYCRDWLAMISILSAVFVHIGFSLYTGAVVLNGLFGFNILLSIIIIAVLIGIYTSFGGLLAVVLTESIETVVLIIGALCITGIGLYKIGGWSGLVNSVEPVKLTLLRSASDSSGLPWYSVLLGYPVIGLWYWCADQTIVQRVLGAKDENHARVGPLFAASLKIFSVFIFVLPGLICYALVREGKLPNTMNNSADTYAFLVANILPVGLKGIVAAALIAAIMGTVSGALNSIATLFSYDIYKRLRPRASASSLVLVGRITTIVAMLAAIAWSPYISHYKSIFQGITAIICYIAPPITTVFLFGVFWKRASSTAAIVTLWAGMVLGIMVFFLDWFKGYTHWTMAPMMATFYLFVICSVILCGISIFISHRHNERSLMLVWANPLESLRGVAWSGLGNYKVITAMLVIIMICLYSYFG